jgi:hypothetical protein
MSSVSKAEKVDYNKRERERERDEKHKTKMQDNKRERERERERMRLTALIISSMFVNFELRIIEAAAMKANLLLSLRMSGLSLYLMIRYVSKIRILLSRTSSL